MADMPGQGLGETPEVPGIEKGHVALLVDHLLMLAPGIDHRGGNGDTVGAAVGITGQNRPAALPVDRLGNDRRVGGDPDRTDIGLDRPAPAVDNQRLAANEPHRLVVEPGAPEPRRDNDECHSDLIPTPAR